MGNVGFILVRDKKTGKPKVDDPATLHPIHLGMMSRAEREELGVHPGPYAVDAQGIKTLSGSSVMGFKAIDALVAVNVIYELPEEASEAVPFSVGPRCDVAAGAFIPANNIKPQT